MTDTTSKGTVLDVLPAGPDHQVVTMAGKAGRYRRKPCVTCPWRKDAVGEFPAEAFRHSAPTAYDMADQQFGCHSSGTAKPATCAGFLLRGAAHNLGVRLRFMRGEVELGAVTAEGVELFVSYREMAEANGVAPDDPALDGCR